MCRGAAEAFAKTSLFAGMAQEQIAEAAEHAVRQAYVTGEVLFQERDSADGPYIVARGTIRLIRKTSNCKTLVIGEESAPCVLITPGVFDGGSNCVTALAIDQVVTYVLPAHRFLQLSRRQPEILLSLLADVSRRLRQTSDFIDLVTVGSIRQRVARVLLDLVDECGSPAFQLPCSQGELALCIGTVREVVFRHLKQLQSEGVLRFHGGDIVIDDMHGLQSAAGPRSGSEHVFGPHATPSIPAYIAPKQRKSLRGRLFF